MSRIRKRSAQQSSLAWYFRRLQSMPLAEIPHRIKEICLRQLFRTASLARRDTRLPTGLSDKTLPALPLQLDGLSSAISTDDAERLRQDTDRL
ncbi:MAG: hypothetical protein ACR2Q3_13775, partial [Woeseiaceae bacterium]